MIVSQRFQHFDQWLQWAEQNRSWALSSEYITGCVEEIRQNGLCDPIFGLVPASEVTIDGTNWRETIAAKLTNSRQRAVLALLVEIGLQRGFKLRTYLSEAITPFARRAETLFKNIVQSEYLPNGSDLHAVMHQDATALTFENEEYDLYISCEVFEHIPSLGKGISEARRILKPGGQFVVTVPFSYMNQEHAEKARIGADGKIECLMTPEYHGNPIDPIGQSLVFTIPGWKILQDCKDVGFSEANIVFISSRMFAITGAECAGCFILVAKA